MRLSCEAGKKAVAQGDGMDWLSWLAPCFDRCPGPACPGRSEICQLAARPRTVRQRAVRRARLARLPAEEALELHLKYLYDPNRPAVG